MRLLTSQARRFGDALVDRHIVSRDMVESALDEAAHTGEPFPDVIARHAELPAWYLPLRLQLTVVACLSLIAGAFVQLPY